MVWGLSIVYLLLSLSSVHLSVLVCGLGIVIGLSFAESQSVLVPVSICTCLVTYCLLLCVPKWFCSVFTEHCSIPSDRNEGYFTQNFNRVLQGIRSLTPADPKALSSKNHTIFKLYLYVVLNSYGRQLYVRSLSPLLMFSGSTTITCIHARIPLCSREVE